MTRYTSRRAVLAASGTALAGALAGCGGSSTGSSGGSSSSQSGSSSNGSSEAVANAPIPSDTSATYATMGSADANAHIVYVGNWKCPYCAQFDTGWFGSFVSDYVATGKVQLTYRCLAYTPNGSPFLGKDSEHAARAALALWHADPGSYWAFHSYVFENQPSESKEWATTDRLLSMMESAGVSAKVRSTVETKLGGDDYHKAVLDTTTYAKNKGITGTPSLVIDGKVHNPLKEEQTRAAVESAISK